MNALRARPLNRGTALIVRAGQVPLWWHRHATEDFLVKVCEPPPIAGNEICVNVLCAGYHVPIALESCNSSLVIALSNDMPLSRERRMRCSVYLALTAARRLQRLVSRPITEAVASRLVQPPTRTSGSSSK